MQHLEESLLRQLYADPAKAATEGRDKIAAARVWLMQHKPFFGVLARALRMQASLEVAAFRLRPDDRVLFHPVVTLQLRFPSLCARLAHLSMHAALGAFGRRKEREVRRWNVAHDLAIEPLLRAAGMSSGVRDGLSRGLGSLDLRSLDLPGGASAEAYYDELVPGTAPDAHWCDLCDPEPDDDPPPVGQYTRQDGGDQQGESQRSGANDGDSDSRDDGRAPSADERGRELQWRMRLGAAFEEELASGGKTFGDRPGWLDEWVRATIEPPAHWSLALQQAVSSLQRNERCYLRPSRRMSALAGAEGPWPDTVTMPGRRVRHAGRLVTVVDTSASIAEGTLARFFGSVVAVANAEGIDDVRLIQADAAVTSDETVFAAELLFREIAVHGRGGTDFAPALRQLAAESKREGERFTVVYLTDLDGHFPTADDAAPLDVLWVVPRETKRQPPFGRRLEMG
jgi:predicted metal-dependent peptidase